MLADVIASFSQLMVLAKDLFDEHHTILRCKQIYDNYLIKLDPELY